MGRVNKPFCQNFVVPKCDCESVGNDQLHPESITKIVCFKVNAAGLDQLEQLPQSTRQSQQLVPVNGRS